MVSDLNTDRVRQPLSDALALLITACKATTSHRLPDPVALLWMLNDLHHIAAALQQLTDFCDKSALFQARQMEGTGYPALVEALADAATRSRHARVHANQTFHALGHAFTSADGARMAAEQVKHCPECGEIAIPQIPKDLTPQQKWSQQRPRWSHRDGTQLCPVMGDGGYQPADPA